MSAQHPFRRDRKPRARWPEHLTHLPLPVPETRELDEAEAERYFADTDFPATAPVDLDDGKEAA